MFHRIEIQIQLHLAEKTCMRLRVRGMWGLQDHMGDVNPGVFGKSLSISLCVGFWCVLVCVQSSRVFVGLSDPNMLQAITGIYQLCFHIEQLEFY